MHSSLRWPYTLLYFIATLGILSCANNENISIPQQPINIDANGKDGYTTLNWPAVQNAQSYNIYFDTNKIVSLAQSKKLTAKQPPFTHTGLLNNTTYYYVITALNRAGESIQSLETSATPISTFGIDPLFNNQWNLENTGQVTGGVPGEDINLSPLINNCTTQDNCRGEGILVAIVDTGLEIAHEDLFANIASGMSYNYLNNSNDPTSSSEWHGTAVAGIIAARDQNNLGLRGIAPRASLAAYNFLLVGDAATAFDALTRDSDNDQLPDAHISVNSWGPPDNGELHMADMEISNALNLGVTSGRNGLGTVYVWAAGNGAAFDIDNLATGECDRSVDNSNYDAYANNPRVMAIAAVTENGTKASYSECGANVWISAPAGEFCNRNSPTYYTITSTDLTGNAGLNNTGQSSSFRDYTDVNYTKCFNGTSAATPTIAGVVALMLQQTNKNLSWRDVRYILASTARKNDPGELSGWALNGAGILVNHKYGFGVVDSDAAVSMAKDPNYIALGAEIQLTSELYTVGKNIPDSSATGVEDAQLILSSSVSKIEYVEITLTATHEYFADLEVVLTHTYSDETNRTVVSESRLAETHLISCQREISNCSSYTYRNWKFGSVRHLDEPADGTWTLSLRDKKTNLTGRFDSWKIKIYGS